MSQAYELMIRRYIGMGLRRKRWILLPLACSLLLGLIYLKVTTKIYRASTLVLLEPQSIPESYVRSTVTESVEARFRTISQQIRSRTKIEQLIAEFHIDQRQIPGPLEKLIQMAENYLPALKDLNLSKEQDENDQQIRLTHLVEQIRENLEVSVRGGMGGRGQHLAFEIAFEWPDPEIVAPVVNRVAARFIEDNLNVREEIASGTTQFLEQETEVIRKELEKREGELESFKRRHIGMLPNQLESNINILNHLREQRLSLERRIDQEKQQALVIRTQGQPTQMGHGVPLSPASQAHSNAAAVRGDHQATMEEFTSGSLDDLNAQLVRLSSFYTDKHPDIIALKRRIETLQKQGTKVSSTTPAGTPAPTPALSLAAAAQLNLANARIDSYQTEMSKVEAQIQTYKERVEGTPQVEMAMNQIIRDYQTVKQRYENLLSKKLDAEMAEQLERRKKGEQFRILDPAIRPAQAVKPVAKKVMFMALFAGLAMGCGLAYLREWMNPCFQHPGEAESLLGVPVFVSLPHADQEIDHGPSQ